MAGELWKNQEELVEATRILQKNYPNITVAIVGSGYQTTIDRLTTMIKDYGLEKNILLTGRVARSDMPQIFFDLDLSVSTHRNEGFGIVHIESLAALTPVVAYNSGGLVEILHKGGGQLVNGGTAEFARAILDLLHDDARREQLGREGRTVIEEYFSIEVMVDSHRHFYEDLVCQ
jgi:glycosyltransferase involved in cell wall biosynthesis